MRHAPSRGDRSPNGLRFEDVSVTLGGRAVLHDLCFEIASGELVALEGPSGAGKTTLVRAAAGLAPHTGRIVVAGQEGRPAIVFQHHALAKRLSARDNVLVGSLGRVGFGRSALGLWPRDEVALAESCLDQVGLAGLGGRRSDTLSGGQRQRVAIARALAQRAPVLLADEPVASLDPASAAAVLDVLRALAGAGMAVLVCLHQPELSIRYADRRLRIEAGRISEM